MLLETLTMLVSTTIGAALQLMAQRQQNEHERYVSLLRHNSIQVDESRQARAFDSNGWTRRIIALVTVFCVILLPKVVILFWPDILVTVSYTQFIPSNIFSSGGDVIKFIVTRGVLISPLDTEIMSAIVGLYFGRSLTKRI